MVEKLNCLKILKKFTSIVLRMMSETPNKCCSSQWWAILIPASEISSCYFLITADDGCKERLLEKHVSPCLSKIPFMMKPQGEDVYLQGRGSFHSVSSYRKQGRSQMKCFHHWPWDRPHLFEFWNSRQKLDKTVTHIGFITVLQDPRVPQKWTCCER